MRKPYALLISSLCCVLVASASPPASAAAAPEPIRGAIVLPSAKRCLAKPELTIRIRKLPRVRWANATITVNGKRLKVLTRTRLAKPFTLKKLPTGRIVLSIKVKTRDRRTATARRTFRTCVAPMPTPTPSPAPQPTPVPTPEPTATPQPSVRAVEPGSYRGVAGGYTLTLYVSPDGKRVQDVTVSTQPGCTVGGHLSGEFIFAEVEIAADGSFAATSSRTGIVSNKRATTTYTFSGRIEGDTASGTLRQDIAHTDPNGGTCTTGDRPWSVTRDAQGAVQTLAPPPPGSYRGLTANSGLTLFVSPDGKRLEDMTVPTQPTCTTGAGTMSGNFQVASVPIAPDGSFNATVTEQAIVHYLPATITYVLKGHVHGTDINGVARIAGQLRQTVASVDGTSINCTTNDRHWWANREAQGPVQTLSPPPPGNYGGLVANSNLTFSVAPGGTLIENVAVPTRPDCTGNGGTPSTNFLVASVPIAANGSFDTTATSTGVVSGRPATHGLRFSGRFHGTNTNGVARVAGLLRHTVTFTDSTGGVCTTNDRTFWALRVP
jgi:hypothetical protein